MNRTRRRQRAAANGMLMLALGSVAVLALLVIGLVAMSGGVGSEEADEQLVLYCAAGMRQPVENAITAYKDDYGVDVRVIYGNSGYLLGQIELLREGDLYIPADESYVQQGREHVDTRTGEAAPLLAEAIDLAKFRLCIAVPPGNPKNIASLDDLLSNDVSFGRANPQAGVGRKTRKLLEQAGRWDQFRDATRVQKDTVNMIAQDVQTESLDAGLVWDTVAKQYGLDVVYVPQFDAGAATINVAVLTDSEQSAAALRFARYLAAPSKGKQYFDKHGYERVPGDKWAWRPKIELFAGTVSRPAIEQTLKEFQEREGVDITVVFNGCGNLVGIMKTDRLPDAYLACDISYEPWMKDRFRVPKIVSEMDLVILVQPGNPKNIRSVADLARPGLEIGIANPEHAALGGVTRTMLRQMNLYGAVRDNVRLHNGGGDLLVANLVGNDTLDAVIVYGANCLHVGPDDGQIIRIEDKQAVAVQPWWQRTDNDYPQLTSRLFDAITSATGRKRYDAAGFRFTAGGDAE